MKIKFENIVRFLCLLSVIATSIIIVCTFLTIYQFLYVSQLFNSYFMIQVGVSITMGLTSIKFLLFGKGKEKSIYSLICFAISLASIFFMQNTVR